MIKKTSDLTVVGAGIAGICAAVAAARRGLTVSLVHDRPVPGGNASSEIGVPIMGSAAESNSPSVYAREGGLVEELKLKLRARGGFAGNGAMLDAVLFEFIYEEKNIELFLNTHVYDVETENGEIKKAFALQTGSEKRFVFESPVFLDSTGDGFLGAASGAKFRQGREAKSEFGEIDAPETADSCVLGDTLLWNTRYKDEPVPFTAPKFAYDITKKPFFDDLKKPELLRFFHRCPDGTFNGLWWVEYGGMCDTVADNEEIVWELRQLVYGFWDYIKNSGEFENVENLELYRVCALPGKRESRRFVGKYMLTQNDIIGKRKFDDAVSSGGWPIDIHAPGGIYDKGASTGWCYVPGLYQIPYRCLYSANIKNLFFAGRNVSVSHMALGSTRVIGTCGAMGQAVGTAAVLCKKYNIIPSGVYESHIDELKNMLLEDDQLIAGVKDHFNDEIVDNTIITASSEKVLSLTKCDKFIPLDKDYCIVLPVETGTLDSVEVLIKNTSKESKKLRVVLYSGTCIDTYSPKEQVKELFFEIPGGFEGYHKLELGFSEFTDGKCYIELSRNEDIYIGMCDEHMTGVVCFNINPPAKADDFRNGPKIKMRRIPEGICFRNVLPVQNLYKAGNLIDGYTRPYSAPRMWMSEGTKNEYVNVEFKQTQKINEIQLFFNSELEVDVPKIVPQKLITEYEIVISDSNGNDKTIEVKDNVLRFCRHRFDALDVKNIRVNLKDNNGAPNMEMFAIRILKQEEDNE